MQNKAQYPCPAGLSCGLTRTYAIMPEGQRAWQTLGGLGQAAVWRLFQAGASCWPITFNVFANNAYAGWHKIVA